MMYDEMLTLICQAIEICVLSTEEACCPFLISFLDFDYVGLSYTLLSLHTLLPAFPILTHLTRRFVS